MKNVYDPLVATELISRLEELDPETQPEWGKMNVGQMLAHVNVSYEMAFEDKHPHAKGLRKFLLRLLVKPGVVNEKPYRKNLRTAPAFLMTDERKFDLEKARLVAYINMTSEKGSSYFEGLPSPSFGPLTAGEWSNLFYKHIDHHLRQFGV